MADTITHPNGRYLTEDEIVAHLIATVRPEHKPSWLRASRRELIAEHHSTGMAIRNHYGLWEPDYPGTSDDPSHRQFPDQISMRIIEKFWEKLRQEYTALGPRSIEEPIKLPPDDGTRLYHEIGHL